MKLSAILKAQHQELGRKLEEATKLNNAHIERCNQLLAKLKQLNVGEV